MKRIRFIQIILVAMLFTVSSCGIFDGDSDSSDNKKIGGDSSPIGAVGNTFNVSSFPGITNKEVEIVTRENGVSTIRASAKVTNQTYLTMAEGVPYLEVNGDVVSVTRQARITTEGIQQVFEDGSFHIVVKYNAKKGDKYEANQYGQTIVREVKEVSKEDDFLWNSMYIKVIQVEETGSGIPGVSKVVYYANHRFGIVGVDVYFEDGSHNFAYVYSAEINN